MPIMRPPMPGLRPKTLENACWQCTRRALLRQQATPRPKFFTKPSLSRASAATITLPPHQRLRAGYFLSNNLLARVNGSNRAQNVAAAPPAASAGASASIGAAEAPQTSAPEQIAPESVTPESINNLLPHRRRQALRKLNASAAASLTSDAPTATLPLDASAQLASAAARHPASSLRRTLSAMLSLSKPRLTVLVVLSAMVPYALYPVPAFLSASALDPALAPSLSPLTLLFLTAGTTLCSASANALNMLYEPDTDAKMSRTRTRPLVRRLLTTRAAVFFAVACAVVGTGSLYLGVNPTVAFLGATNIALYAGAYTPLKRISVLNTWVGAIVGGIPPLMGWAAAAGESATADGTWRELLFAADGSSYGGWLFAGLLFAWQFPHFMPLSWGIREEYKAAGLRMLAWVNPARNSRVALRYSLAFIPLCVGLCAVGVTEWSFAVTSLPVNAWLVAEAVKFWRHEGHKGSAKGLFWASVWHLPVVMVLALAQKKGMWQRVWRSVMGEPDEEEEWEDDDDNEGEPMPAPVIAKR
ncbi:UbiA prenyltransferase family-domain-containing protein [Podospora aff. communis PSN243]|uniref:Protoheme IX farnesyltransferase, mitochondrial n=1 Tax=Podospora aff. communis PSN243 TaxID=3040156 RepID=A0AAV9GBV9_9PEZI|nr:UbiA prenyltransferase family-domain-containing protein [Podospora aff. communis PSN243]